MLRLTADDSELTASDTVTITVQSGGGEVQLAFVPGAECGDWVLVHVGVAISCIDEAEAERVLAALEASLAPEASS